MNTAEAIAQAALELHLAAEGAESDTVRAILNNQITNLMSAAVDLNLLAETAAALNSLLK